MRKRNRAVAGPTGPGQPSAPGKPAAPGQPIAAGGAGQAVARPEVPVGRWGRRREELRRAAAEVVRHWDALHERVPEPVLRILVTLPWLARRMPVPFWVPVLWMVVRRLQRRRQRKAARRAAAESST